MGAEQVTVYGDPMLVVKQVSKEWEVREDKLRLYWDFLATITLSFSQCRFVHFPREDNQVADTLTTLTSMWQDSKYTATKPFILARSRTPCYEEISVMSVEPRKKSQFYDLYRYLEIGQFFEDVDKKERMSMKMLSRSAIMGCCIRG